MPINKNANFRQRILDRLFQQRNKRWILDELVAEVSHRLWEEFDISGGISKRSIESDIYAMRKEKAPISRGVPGNPGFTYDDPKYGHFKSELTAEDRSTLLHAILLLRQFHYLPHYPNLQKTLERLEGNMRHHLREGFDIIQFERNDRAQGTNWIAPLYRAIAARTVVRIDYQPFNAGEAQHYRMHPYLLKEYRNRWFLFGHAVEPDAIYNFALDRIRSVQPCPELPFVYNPEFDPGAWFRDIIGVTRYRDRQPIDIVFRTTPQLGPYLDSKPLHHSQQRLEASETGWRFFLYLIPNPELKAELRRFGPDLTLESPETLD